MSFPLFLRSGFIGLCVAALLVQTRALLSLPPVLDFQLLFIAGMAIFAYNFTHADKFIRRAAWLTGLVAGVSIVFWFKENDIIRGLLVPLLLWGAYYGFQWPGTSGLRNLPFAKPLVVAVTWSWVTVILPALPLFNPGVALMTLERTAFLFTLTLAFDLADRDYDRKTGLPTLARCYGPKSVFRLINLALAMAGACVWANYLGGSYTIRSSAALTVSLLFSAWFLPKIFLQKKFIADRKILIDALIPLQAALVLLLR